MATNVEDEKARYSILQKVVSAQDEYISELEVKLSQLENAIASGEDPSRYAVLTDAEMGKKVDQYKSEASRGREVMEREILRLRRELAETVHNADTESKSNSREIGKLGQENKQLREQIHQMQEQMSKIDNSLRVALGEKKAMSIELQRARNTGDGRLSESLSERESIRSDLERLQQAMSLREDEFMKEKENLVKLLERATDQNATLRHRLEKAGDSVSMTPLASARTPNGGKYSSALGNSQSEVQYEESLRVRLRSAEEHAESMQAMCQRIEAERDSLRESNERLSRAADDSSAMAANAKAELLTVSERWRAELQRAENTFKNRLLSAEESVKAAQTEANNTSAAAQARAQRAIQRAETAEAESAKSAATVTKARAAGRKSAEDDMERWKQVASARTAREGALIAAQEQRESAIMRELKRRSAWAQHKEVDLLARLTEAEGRARAWAKRDEAWERDMQDLQNAYSHLKDFVLRIQEQWQEREKKLLAVIEEQAVTTEARDRVATSEMAALLDSSDILSDRLTQASVDSKDQLEQVSRTLETILKSAQAWKNRQDSQGSSPAIKASDDNRQHDIAMLHAELAELRSAADSSRQALQMAWWVLEKNDLALTEEDEKMFAQSQNTDSVAVKSAGVFVEKERKLVIVQLTREVTMLRARVAAGERQLQEQQRDHSDIHSLSDVTYALSDILSRLKALAEQQEAGSSELRVSVQALRDLTQGATDYRVQEQTQKLHAAEGEVNLLNEALTHRESVAWEEFRAAMEATDRERSQWAIREGVARDEALKLADTLARTQKFCNEQEKNALREIKGLRSELAGLRRSQAEHFKQWAKERKALELLQHNAENKEAKKEERDEWRSRAERYRRALHTSEQAWAEERENLRRAAGAIRVESQQKLQSAELEVQTLRKGLEILRKMEQEREIKAREDAQTALETIHVLRANLEAANSRAAAESAALAEEAVRLRRQRTEMARAAASEQEQSASMSKVALQRAVESEKSAREERVALENAWRSERHSMEVRLRGLLEEKDVLNGQVTRLRKALDERDRVQAQELKEMHDAFDKLHELAVEREAILSPKRSVQPA